MASFIRDTKERTAQRLAAAKPAQKNQSIVQMWQKTPTPELTKQVLDSIAPTIDSALHTYTPGQQSTYKIKATKYALDSLRNYDAKRKVSPNTFVFSELRRLSRIKRQRQNIVHIPQSRIYQQMQVNKAIADLTDAYDRQPTDQQLADKLHVSKAKLAKMLQSAQASTIPQSAAVDVVTGQSTFSKNAVDDNDYFDYVYRSVSPQDKLIMQYTAGKGKPVLSNNQIAKKLKLSPGAVSQHKAKIQSMLQQVRGLV